MALDRVKSISALSAHSAVKGLMHKCIEFIVHLIYVKMRFILKVMKRSLID